jgi:hypothetical protein
MSHINDLKERIEIYKVEIDNLTQALKSFNNDGYFSDEEGDFIKSTSYCKEFNSQKNVFSQPGKDYTNKIPIFLVLFYCCIGYLTGVFIKKFIF